MYLSREDEAMLKGEMGLALQKAMEFLVKLGDAYEAKDMVRVSSCHTVSCVYNVVYEAGIEVAEKLLSMGARFQVPTTLCTASVPMKDAEVFGFPDDWIKAQQRLRELYKAMGAIDNWTCIPYWNINVPRFGEHVAWGESNCVSYANSVIGARTNRYSSYMEVCAAIAGRVPRIGLHLAENRKGHTLVKLRGLKHDKLTDMDYGLLGYAVGLAVKGQIPVVEGIPSSVSKRQLRSMGAAAASSGAVALYQALGVTP
ncbi:MAG: aconitase X, partial [Candidatus Bathyarchaeia archaeon]